MRVICRAQRRQERARVGVDDRCETHRALRTGGHGRDATSTGKRHIHDLVRALKSAVLTFAASAADGVGSVQPGDPIWLTVPRIATRSALRWLRDDQPLDGYALGGVSPGAPGSASASPASFALSRRLSSFPATSLISIASSLTLSVPPRLPIISLALSASLLKSMVPLF